MKNYYFISDAHFGAHNQKLEFKKLNRLFSFFEHIQKAESHLFILGDFFDVWFEYKNAVPNRHFRLLNELFKLIENGIKVDFVAGNHDYWLHDFLEREIGLRIHQRPIDINLDGNRFFIAHGDGLIKSQRTSRLLSYITKHPINIYLYRLLPPDLAIPLAAFCSKLSRGDTAKSPKKHRQHGNFEKFALNKLVNGFDGVILGHTHKPALLHFNDKSYLNTGDWVYHFSYGMLKNGKLSLNYWNNELAE
ncbi:UDP-2,3-diacylglucosamine diphosphatase [candidate division KSB1 bacterium]|nr:UDP-2,3-diacylglucosamine diphosphatase [candidate division KSB1 bacterium]